MVETVKRRTSLEITNIPPVAATTPNLPLVPQQQKMVAPIIQTSATTPVATAAAAATTLIQEQPILDRVEKVQHIDVVQEQKIHETRIQDQIEVHEKPIEKIVEHPMQQTYVQERPLFEEQGRLEAEQSRLRVLRELEERNRMHNVTMAQRQEITHTQIPPSFSMDKQVTREIIEKPIVTEIHHQPVTEIHEQLVNKTIYEPPLVTVVREAPITERVVVNEAFMVTPPPPPQMMTTTTTTTTVSPVMETVIIEKKENELYPHVEAIIDSNMKSATQL